LKPKINIEEIVRKHLQEEGRSITWLCRKLNWERKKMYRFFDNGSILTEDLWAISYFTKHDFFKYLSNELNSNTVIGDRPTE
jgi:hypothetical protein